MKNTLFLALKLLCNPYQVAPSIKKNVSCAYLMINEVNVLHKYHAVDVGCYFHELNQVCLGLGRVSNPYYKMYQRYKVDSCNRSS